jgi:MFS transporter, MHS family, proline/betaine transporter
MPGAPAPAPSPPLTRIIVAASIGNALEWFDLAVYGYFAVAISSQFFPKADPAVALLLTFGTFGVSYLTRPLGAIVLGAYADRAGRRASLMVSVLLMTVGTFIMVVIPPYASIGLLAPIGMFVARLMQGFLAGGEFGSSTAFLAEHGAQRKGFLASWQWSSQGMSSLLSSLFGIVLVTTLLPSELQVWGWRVPYVFGLLIGPVGFYIRRQVEETPEFLGTERTQRPVRDVLRGQWDRLLLAIGVVVMSTSTNYLILYMPTYAVTQLHLPQVTGFFATLLSASVQMMVSPLAGHVSDRASRTRIMQALSLLLLLSVYPAFMLLSALAMPVVLVLVVGWFGLVKSSYGGMVPSLMAEIFPTQTRGTGLALSYNIGVPLFGGFAPVIIQSLIGLTGDRLAPAFYLMSTAVLSLVTLVLIRRRLRLR